ncbi:Non-ribosomal peptide synthetase [Actinosynnema pretiosum subsp. pretiosum]|nr:Non-ribosomal peptide synthetase [Actinosynnema pretiosum subsp. pretiosum]
MRRPGGVLRRAGTAPAARGVQRRGGAQADPAAGRRGPAAVAAAAGGRAAAGAADRPAAPARAGTAGGHVPLRVGPELVERARECARRHGASLFMVLLAVFLTALRGWGGQEDLSVGVPLSGREGPEEEAMVGLFTNTVVMRVDVSGAPSFPELLRRVRSVAFDAYDDGDVPFSHVVEAVSPPRDPSRTPLFQAVFTVQDFAEDDLRLPGVTAEPLPSPGGTSEFDVELELALDGAGLVGFVQYAADLFDPASAAAFADDYLASLRRAVEESR